MKRRQQIILLIALLLAAAAVFCACGGDEKEPEAPKPTIIEPGVSEPEPEPEPAGETEADPAQDEEPPQEEDGFVDLGRATTIEDLMANKAKIHSFYYEQTIGYSAGDIHIKTWYKDGIMKMESSFPGAPPTVDFYDYYECLLISYTPAVSKNAIMIPYEEGDPEMPENPLAYNYHDYRVLDTETVNGQLCRVLEGRGDTKLWIATNNGFPLQVEFIDTQSDEHFIVTYENIILNQVSSEDVLIPDDLVIYEMLGGVGY